MGGRCPHRIIAIGAGFFMAVLLREIERKYETV
jgi:hypothetical protein